MMERIREVTPEDSGRIADIYNEYVLHSVASFETEPVSVAEMATRIEKVASQYPYYVYEVDGEVVGFCYAHLWKERKAYGKTLETTIYLDPAAIGMGIGTAMMKKLIDECRRLGYASLIADITAENEASCALHRKLGFRQVSHFERVGFKLGRWLDVVDYELLL